MLGWAGLGHRGFCNGVGGLCFAAQSSKSCLSVLNSWTSCNNTNGPLNRLLCLSGLGYIPHTLARSETHVYDGADWQPHSHAHKFIPKTYVHTLVNTGGHADMHASTNMHRDTQQYTLDHN